MHIPVLLADLHGNDAQGMAGDTAQTFTPVQQRQHQPLSLRDDPALWLLLLLIMAGVVASLAIRWLPRLRAYRGERNKLRLGVQQRQQLPLHVDVCQPKAPLLSWALASPVIASSPRPTQLFTTFLANQRRDEVQRAVRLCELKRIRTVPEVGLKSPVRTWRAFALTNHHLKTVQREQRPLTPA